MDPKIIVQFNFLPREAPCAIMLGASALTAAATALTALHCGVIDAAVWRVPVERHVAPSRATALDPHVDPLVSWGSHTKHSRVWTPSFTEDLIHAADDIDFISDGRNFYSAKILFGSPPQPIALVLSLGATDMMALNHKVGTHAYYDHAESSTYQVNGTRISLYEGTAYAIQGFVSSDHITIPGQHGSRDGLTVRDLSFLEMESPDSFLKDLPPGFDGSIGLGARAQNATGMPSIIQSMIAQGLLDQPVVGVHMDDKNAHLTFGGIDPQYKTTDITYFTETRNEAAGWWVPLSSVEVNGEPVAGSGGPAMILEMVDVIYGPPDQIAVLARAASVVNYRVPCDGPGPDVTITLGEFEVTLKKADYTIPEGDACLFGFFPVPNLNHWVLGRPFLNHVYMVLDYGKTENDTRLGLAHLKSE